MKNPAFLVFVVAMAVINSAAPVHSQQIATGPYHTCMIAGGAHVYCFGGPTFGSVFIRSTKPVHDPYVHVASGTNLVCAITKLGTSRCWSLDPFISRPDLVPGTLADTWTQVAVGTGFACHLALNGSVWCLGDNSKGQCNAPIGTFVSFHMISAGDAHACGVTSTRQLRCWGSNTAGQTDFSTVATLQNVSIAFVACGWNATCAITTASVVGCWGGFFSTVQAPVGPGWYEISVGLTSYFASGNILLCAPADTYGAAPVNIDPLAELGAIRQLTMGHNHVCALSKGAKATLVCWGSNVHGQARLQPAELVSVNASIVSVELVGVSKLCRLSRALQCRLLQVNLSHVASV